MAVIDWTLTGLIPTSGLVAWHLYDPNTSTNGRIDDGSSNMKPLIQAATPPVLTLNHYNGQTGWYFSGTSNPVATASSAVTTAKHVFIMASHEDATFSTNRGLLSGKTSGNWLTSDASGNKFFSFGADYDYRKSDVSYADANMVAPMSGIPELIEIKHTTTGVPMAGFQVGQQLADTSRKWKGYFYEQMIYDRELTLTERLQIHLYFNIKFGTWSMGVPRMFPDARLLTGTQVLAPTRFDDIEPDFDQITDSWEYEDGGEDFNEVSPTAPLEWEYEMKVIANGDIARGYAEREIFEGFYKAMRKVNSFYFVDKWNQVWSDVRIKSYQSTHSEHKSWQHNIVFRLRASTSSVVVAILPSAALYLEDGSGYLTDG